MTPYDIRSRHVLYDGLQLCVRYRWFRKLPGEDTASDAREFSEGCVRRCWADSHIASFAVVVEGARR